MNRITISIAFLLWSISSLSADKKSPFTEGELTMRISHRSEYSQTHRYQLKNSQLLIYRPGEIIPAPSLNLIDLNTGLVKIIYPHNGTWREYSSNQESTSTAFPSLPKFPSGIFPNISPPTIPTPPFNIGPGMPGSPPSGLELGSAPPSPQPGIPPIPVLSNFPASAFAAIPSMPGTNEPPTLTKAGATRMIHGYDCQRYTLEIPQEGTLTLWLTDSLPPFHILISHPPAKQHRTQWRDHWPSLLREKKLFPLLAILRPTQEEDREANGSAQSQDQEISRWEITQISPKIFVDQELAAFTVPADFHRLDP